MPRKTIRPEQPAVNVTLVDKLARELKAEQESGQPLVYEQELAAGRLRVTVVWDEWDGIPLEDRTPIILQAYKRAEGESYDRIALATGLTVPEATAAGMLTYQVGTALRKDDPVTREQVGEAMLAEGASKLFGPDVLQLRFATEEEAEACRQRLIKRLAKSDNVWTVNREISVQDFITLSHSVEAALN